MTEVQTEPAAAPTAGRARRGACLAAVFCTGCAVLVHEIMAAAFVAPVFGSGMDVWGAVLAVTLSALAAGYFLGGVRLERLAGSRSVPWLIAAAGVALLLSVLSATAWRPAEMALDGTGLLIAVLTLLGPPILLLAVVSPWMVQVYTRTGCQPGQAAGRLYAVSTVGGVVGALAAGFVTAVLLGATVVWGLLDRSGRGAAWCASLVLAVAIAAAAAVLGPGSVAWQDASNPSNPSSSTVPELGNPGVGTVLAREDGYSGRREVIRDGAQLKLLVNGILQTSMPVFEGSAFGGGVFAPGALLAHGNALELVPYLRPDAQRVLLIGLGGGAVAKQLAGYGLRVECVELDPGIVRLARTWFGFDGTCTVDDGRRFLLRRAEPFDAVLLDVYRGESLPGHLCTREFFALVRRHLRADGILGMNLIGAAAGGDTRAILRTVHAAFDDVMLFAPDGGGDGRTLAPMILFAAPGNRGVLHEDTEDRLVADGFALPPAVDLSTLDWQGGELLTDDRNPLAALRRGTAALWRRMSLRR